MTHSAQVNFRDGKRDVEFYYEGDGVIVWGFIGEDVCFGADTTEREQQQVLDQLWPLMDAHFEWLADA